MAKGFMKIVGIVFVVLGIVGFFFQFEDIFNLTALHNVIHLASGIVALAVSGSEAKSVLWAKIFGYVYLAVAVLGVFVQNIGNGLLYLLPADNVLHFILTIAFLYVGYKSASSSASVGKSA